MPTTIKLKNSVTTTNAPSSLVQGEVAINITDKKVWVGNAATTPIQLLGTGASINLTSLTTSNDCSISGLTVGKGGGAVSGNTVVGNLAMVATASGSNNTAIGSQSLNANTSGASNTSVGAASMYLNTTGGNNAALGQQSLYANTSGSYNVGLGQYALYSNTTASNNTAVGYQASYSNTTGTNNISIGYAAGYSNSTGQGIIAIGSATAYNTTASWNTAIGGGNTFYANTSGTANTAVGGGDGTNDPTMRRNTTGSYNTALGSCALASNTTASNNTAVGYQAGYTNTTGTNSTYIGRQAGYSATGGSNTFVGSESGESVTTGSSNAFFGEYSGQGATTGTYNTFVGAESGYLITTGSKNAILGRYNGNQGGLDIRTASNYIVLSDGDGNPRAYWRNDGVGFTTANATDGYALQIRNSTATRPYAAAFVFTAATPNNTTETFLDCEDTTNQKAKIYSNGTFGSRTSTYGGISDEKLKQDIVDASSQWNDIKAVRVRKFRFKDEPNSPLQLGVIAQEIEQTSAGLVFETPDFVRNEDGGKIETGEVTKSVKYSILYMKAIKALQEAMERIETLEAKVQQLENK